MLFYLLFTGAAPPQSVKIQGHHSDILVKHLSTAAIKRLLTDALGRGTEVDSIAGPIMAKTCGVPEAVCQLILEATRRGYIFLKNPADSVNQENSWGCKVENITLELSRPQIVIKGLLLQYSVLNADIRRALNVIG